MSISELLFYPFARRKGDSLLVKTHLGESSTSGVNIPEKSEEVSSKSLTNADQASCLQRREEVVRNMQARCDSILKKMRPQVDGAGIDSHENSESSDLSSATSSEAAKNYGEQSSSQSSPEEQARRINEQFERINKLVLLPDKLGDRAELAAASQLEVEAQNESTASGVQGAPAEYSAVVTGYETKENIHSMAKTPFTVPESRNISAEEEAIIDHVPSNRNVQEMEEAPVQHQMKAKFLCVAVDMQCACHEQKTHAGIPGSELKILKDTTTASDESVEDDDVTYLHQANELILEVFARVYRRKQAKNVVKDADKNKDVPKCVEDSTDGKEDGSFLQSLLECESVDGRTCRVVKPVQRISGVQKKQSESHAGDDAYLLGGSFKEESVKNTTSATEDKVVGAQLCEDVVQCLLAEADGAEQSENKRGKSDFPAAGCLDDSNEREEIGSVVEEDDKKNATELVYEAQSVPVQCSEKAERGLGHDYNQRTCSFIQHFTEQDKLADKAVELEQGSLLGVKDDGNFKESGSDSNDATKESEVSFHDDAKETLVRDESVEEDDDNVQQASELLQEVYARVRRRKRSESGAAKVNDSAEQSFEDSSGETKLDVLEHSTEDEESFGQLANDIMEEVYILAGCRIGCFLQEGRGDEQSCSQGDVVTAPMACCSTNQQVPEAHSSSSTDMENLEIRRRVTYAAPQTERNTTERGEPSVKPGTSAVRTPRKRLLQSKKWADWMARARSATSKKSRDDANKPVKHRRLLRTFSHEDAAQFLLAVESSSHGATSVKSASDDEHWHIIDLDDAGKLVPHKDFIVIGDVTTAADEYIVVLDPSKIPSKRDFAGKEEYNEVMADLLLYAQYFIEEKVHSQTFVITVHSTEERRSRLRSRKWVTEFYKLWKKRYRDRLTRCVFFKPSFKLKAFVKLSLPFLPDYIKDRLVIVKSRRNFAKAQGLPEEPSEQASEPSLPTLLASFFEHGQANTKQTNRI